MKIESGKMVFNLREFLALELFSHMDFDKDKVEGKPCLYNKIILAGMFLLLWKNPMKFVCDVIKTGADLGNPEFVRAVKEVESQEKGL